MPGVSLVGGRLYRTGYDGLRSGAALDRLDTHDLMAARRPRVILVHGYRWDAGSDGSDNPHLGQFPKWRDWAGADALGFGWQSKPTFCHAWDRSRMHPYHRAWDAAARVAGYALRRMLTGASAPVTLVGHSLGTRVILQALARGVPDGVVPRVLLLNGAESVANARDVAGLMPGTRFYNVGTKNDRVLRYLGGLFSPGAFYERVIGLHGLGAEAPDNWREFWLDSPRHRRWAEAAGWDHKGSGVFGFGAHWASHEWAGNHPFLSRIVDGDRFPAAPR